MQTLLDSRKSDKGGPYVYYDLFVEPSNRTATQVDLTFTLDAYIFGSQGYISSGELTGYFRFPNNQTRNFDVYEGGYTWNERNSPQSVTDTWTIQVEASATSIPFQFWVERSGGNAGTLYELELNATIPIGHIKPTISGYTITETNPLLVNAGLSNNVFVTNLSIKRFNINYQLYEGATLYRALVGNKMKYMYSNTTLPIDIDYRQNALFIDENNKTPFWVAIDDTYQNQHTRTAYTNAGTTQYGTLIYDYYDYINYTPISLTETSTTAKRDGQVSGKVNLNVNGTYFTGTIGNISQATYKPVIKYKFWRADGTEPSTYAYTIPSTNISISGTTFSVTDYAIGSTNPSATNYFDPDYAYRIKIQVDDNFSTYYSQEKSIPVGEATWTEYPNHVDFKAITIGSNPIIESGSNSNGSYVKWADGTMMCWKSTSPTTNITNSWGSVYESTSAVSFGNWAATFYATPMISVTKTTGQGCWMELVQNTSKTSCGSTYYVSAVSRSNVSPTVNIVGFGRWKA